MKIEEIFINIESCDGYSLNLFGIVKSNKCKKERIIKESISFDGYKRVQITKNYKKFTVTLHRLLAQTFIPNPFNKLEVNHIDGDKLNNDISNLEWCDRRYNVQHGYDNGLYKNHPFKINHPNIGKTGDECTNSKKVDQYDINSNFIRTWGCIKDVMREIGIDSSTISKVCRGIKNTAGGYIWRYNTN